MATVGPLRTHLAMVGLMGSGKTSVGGLVAARLGIPLVDVDDAIQARTGRSVGELWETGGEAAYRPHERAVVVAALSHRERSVLAAPGGVVDDPTCLASLRQPHVAVVYLRAEPAVLARRLADDDQPRPLLGDDPLGVLRRQHASRDARYAALADLVVRADEHTPEDIAARTLAAGLLRPPRADPVIRWARR